MKSKLQYAYSISVLVGVLATAYLMMNRSEDHGFLFRSQAPSYQVEARMADPAVSKLLEMESAFQELSKEKKKDDKRLPADVRVFRMDQWSHEK